ncbi:hypothetical protein AKO1_006301, partial [Acrasis kona]
MILDLIARENDIYAEAEDVNDPNLPQRNGFDLLGIIYSRSGRQQEAIAFYEEILNNSDKHSKKFVIQVLHSLAPLYELCDMPEQAFATYKQIVEQDPNVFALLGCVRNLQKLERTEEAASILHHAISMYPDEPMVYTSAASAMINAGRMDEARKYLEDIDQKRPHLQLKKWLDMMNVAQDQDSISKQL